MLVPGTKSMSLARSGNLRDASSGTFLLANRSRNFALRLVRETSWSVLVSMTETTGAVVVFTPARSTQTLFAALASARTQAASTRFRLLQSATAVHAVVVTLGPIGPRGE